MPSDQRHPLLVVVNYKQPSRLVFLENLVLVRLKRIAGDGIWLRGEDLNL